MTEFVCAYFGKDWTITARGFKTSKQAHEHGEFMMPIPGTFGYAVIAETGDDWQVRYNKSQLPPKAKVTRTDLLNYDVCASA